MAAAHGHVLVVGASLGGLRAAEQLRAAGHEGPITVLGEEIHLPYNRPPLSKEVLTLEGDHDVAGLHEQLAFRRRSSVADVEFRLGRKAVAADLKARTVTLDDGTVLDYDGLVVATGLRPRPLDVPGPQQGRVRMRTLEHAVALRQLVADDPAVAIVGAGFIGVELACTLRKLGADATVVYPEAVPQSRVLGTEVGDSLRRHLAATGIRFAPGRTVTRVTGEAEATGIELDDGTLLSAHAVVEAIGSICNTEWLDGNGLDLSDGVLCDNDMRVAGAEGVVAVGDVARFPNPLFDDVPRRVEHWSIPTDTAKRAAATLVADLGGGQGPTEPFAPIPSFWSDQYDLRLQAYGSPSLGEEIHVEEGSLDSPADGLLATYHHDGRHVGSLAVNLPPARHRELRDAFARLVPTA